MIYKIKEVVLKDKILENVFIEIKDGKFGKILENWDGEYEDYSSFTMAPGYVDTHIHGYGGHDVMDLDPEGFLKICQGIVENGVTSFLATTLTSSTENLDKACQVVGENYEKSKGAKVKGIFLEGPFFTEKHKGAQNPKYFSDPDIKKLKRWKELSKGLVNKIAIAPERDGSVEFIKEAKKIGVSVALGHSDATYEEAYKAVMAGANIFVHIYNGMSGLHHRKPGMVGAALSTEDTTAEIIADGHHVHPAAIKVVLKAKNYDHTALITDCMMAGGLEEGDYQLGEFDVRVEGGTARLKEGGSLAGSILKLDGGVRNIYNWKLATKFEAIQMASQIPAKSVGIDDTCGIIEEGRDADFNLLDDDLNIVATFIDGKKR
ncbi:MAG: N-acetylglucosamine-6-phosphate deacetylase [Gallicola sp.]|nr:N-acetylglucosamine-6-phosphate deacetylase [Gallicola sp.]